ncbi:hypothetical protein PXH69_34405, partial [Rhodococcus qingshengii]
MTKEIKEFRGAQRLDRRQPGWTHCEPRSGSLAGSEASRFRSRCGATISALLAVGVAGFAGYFALQGRITV